MSELPADQPPIKLDQLDRLEIENSILKINNLALQRSMLQKDFERANKEIGDLQGQLEQLKSRIEEKYGIDMKKDKIEADGTVVRG